MAAKTIKHCKVAIIGAGIAGLAASQKLVEAEINDIVVLEAQDKIGGRVLTSWQNTGDLFLLFLYKSIIAHVNNIIIVQLGNLK